MKKIMIPLLFIMLFAAAAYGRKDNKVIYKYKKYEKFDFEDLMVEGDQGVPGDISVNPRFKREYRNELPQKPNFNEQLHDAVESIN